MEKNNNKIQATDETVLTPEETAVLNANESAHDDMSRFNPSFEKAKEYKGRALFFKIITYSFLTLFALFMLLPFWFMVTISLKPPIEYEKEVLTGLRLFTTSPTFNNFRIILGQEIANPVGQLGQELATALANSSTQINFVPYFVNTIVVAVLSTVFTIITTIMASFAFARLEFKGKNFLFAILLATMMIPGEMMIITNHQTALGFGLENTFAALIFVHGVSVFYIFYLRQTFQQIPNELFLAAKVDGYGEFRYLWRVMIPIAMPTIVTIIILNVMGSWNAYIWPTLISSGNNQYFESWWGIEHSMRLVSNGLMDAFQGEFGAFNTVKVAGSMIISLPLLFIFIMFRKFIMSGVSRSGIKG